MVAWLTGLAVSLAERALVRVVTRVVHEHQTKAQAERDAEELKQSKTEEDKKNAAHDLVHDTFC